MSLTHLCRPSYGKAVAALTGWETRLFVVIASGLLLVSSLPYMAGYVWAPAGTEFGGFLINLDDSYSYVSAMQQGMAGAWRYQVLYTPEEHPGAYLHIFYILLGKLSLPLGLNPVQTYHLLRLCCGLTMLIAAYLFLSLFLHTAQHRLAALSLIGFSSGLGWVVLLTGSTDLRGLLPVDFWMTGAYTFFTMFTFPHSAAAVTMLLLFVFLAVRHVEKPQVHTLLLAATANVVLCAIHPFTILLVWGILATYWVLLFVSRRQLPRYEAAAFVVWALAPAPLIVYFYSAFLVDRVLANWAAQNILLSPAFPRLLLGYGLLVPLAAGGALHILHRWDERKILLLAWVLAAVTLLYMPFTLQRRMVEGLHVPISVLATIGLFDGLVPYAMRSKRLSRFACWRGYTKQGLRRLLVFSVIVATFPSSLCVLVGSSASALHHDPDLFHEREEIEALEWLGRNTAVEDTVLTSYRVGRYIPARIGHRVFMGHFHETVERDNKILLAQSFFSEGTSDRDRRRVLSEYGIRYVFYGPSEKEMGASDLSQQPYLTPVYRNDLVTIYGVQL
jgi:hypothetical protein